MSVGPEVRALVHKTSVVSATIGVVLSPIPLLDELVLIPVYAAMTKKIAKHHAVEKVPWRPFAKSATAGLIARGIVNLAFVAIPGVSTAVDAATAAGLAEILGEHVDALCQDPERTKPLTIKEVVGMLRRAAEKVRQKRAAAATSAA